MLNLENREVVDTLEHTIEEERNHVTERVRLIQNPDRAQGEKFRGIL
jgi:rubrerythrin